MAERLVPAGAELPPLQTLEDAYPRTTPQARANRHRADRPRYTAPGETGQDGSVAGRRLPIGMNTQRAARSPAHAFGLPACPPHVNLQNDRVESYTEPAADSYRVHAPLPLGRKRGAGDGADLLPASRRCHTAPARNAALCPTLLPQRAARSLLPEPKKAVIFSDFAGSGVDTEWAVQFRAVPDPAGFCLIVCLAALCPPPRRK